MLKVISWDPFGSCLLNRKANPAQFGWKWDGLAVLFSRQLPNGSHDLFHIFAFLTHIFLAIGGVIANNKTEKI